MGRRCSALSVAGAVAFAAVVDSAATCHEEEVEASSKGAPLLPAPSCAEMPCRTPGIEAAAPMLPTPPLTTPCTLAVTQHEPAAATLGPGEVRVEIPVSGMHCGHCASWVETALEKLEGVRSADVRLSDGKVVVVFEKAKLAPSKLIETIDALGFKAGTPSQG